MNIVYVGSSRPFDGGGVEVLGRSLARHLSTPHELRVCGGILRPDSPVFEDPVTDWAMSADELDEFDVVYMEAGWNEGFPAELSYLTRFSLELAESYVRRGGQLIVADVYRANVHLQRQSLEEAAGLFGASVSFGKVGRKTGVCYLYDEDAQEGYGTRFFPGQMYVDDWLEPALEGIDSILAAQAVNIQPLTADIAASGNANTAIRVEDVFVQEKNRILTWASVNAYGRGHAVLVGAQVSDDRLVDVCPDNASWISNLIALLTERSRETAEWAAPVRRQKPVGIPNLHLSISAASGAQFANGHYDEAVFAALKAVEHRVQTLTGSTDSGKTLMANIFNEKSATLDIAHDNVDARQKADEAEGFKFLFMGATQGLRNPRAHGAHVQTDEQEAMEMLATASLLMRALDRAEMRIPPAPG